MVPDCRNRPPAVVWRGARDGCFAADPAVRTGCCSRDRVEVGPQLKPRKRPGRDDDAFLVPLATMTTSTEARCLSTLRMFRFAVSVSVAATSGSGHPRAPPLNRQRHGLPIGVLVGGWSVAAVNEPLGWPWAAVHTQRLECRSGGPVTTPRPVVLSRRPKSTQVHPESWLHPESWRIRTSRVLRPDPSPLRLSVSPNWPSRTIANPVLYSASVQGRWSLVSTATPVLV